MILWPCQPLQHLLAPLHSSLTSHNNNKLIFIKQLQSSHTLCEVGINEETKVQRGYILVQGHTASGRHSWESNPGHLTLERGFFITTLLPVSVPYSASSFPLQHFVYVIPSVYNALPQINSQFQPKCHFLHEAFPDSHILKVRLHSNAIHSSLLFPN